MVGVMREQNGDKSSSESLHLARLKCLTQDDS